MNIDMGVEVDLYQEETVSVFFCTSIHNASIVVQRFKVIKSEYISKYLSKGSRN